MNNLKQLTLFTMATSLSIVSDYAFSTQVAPYMILWPIETLGPILGLLIAGVAMPVVIFVFLFIPVSLFCLFFAE